MATTARVFQEKWDMFPTIADFSVLKKMETLKNKFTKECKKREDLDDLITELEETYTIASLDRKKVLHSTSAQPTFILFPSIGPSTLSQHIPRPFSLHTCLPERLPGLPGQHKSPGLGIKKK